MPASLSLVAKQAELTKDVGRAFEQGRDLKGKPKEATILFPTVANPQAGHAINIPLRLFTSETNCPWGALSCS